MNRMTAGEFDIYFDRISNHTLYGIRTDKVVRPEVPKIYIESQDRYVENPNHPVYPDALRVYEYKKGEQVLDFVINSIVVNGDYPELSKKKLTNLRSLQPNKSNEFLIKKYIILNDDEIQSKILNEICLTENRVYDHFDRYNVQRGGVPIIEHGLKNAINTSIEAGTIVVKGVQIVNPIEEYKVVKDARMDWYKWISNEYTLDTMAMTVAMYRWNKVIDIHNQDEVQIESERQSKRKH